MLLLVRNRGIDAVCVGALVNAHVTSQKQQVSPNDKVCVRR